MMIEIEENPEYFSGPSVNEEFEAKVAAILAAADRVSFVVTDEQARAVLGDDE